MKRDLSIHGEDTRPASTRVFCYAIRNVESPGESFFLTSYEDGVIIEGLPDDWEADGEQVFAPAQITHGKIEKRDGIDKISFDIQVRLAEIQAFSRYILFASIPRIKIDVMKLPIGKVLSGEPITYDEDVLTVESGIIETFGTRGYIMSARCVPEALITGHQVPRWRFTRTCNRQLYAPDCGVDPEDFKLEGTILSMDYRNKSLVVSGQRTPAAAEDYFRQGVLIHVDTGSRHSVIQSQFATGGNTRIWLPQWFPDFEIGDDLTLFAGCEHTVGACSGKFNNFINFGGFPLIPSKNPSVHGA